MRGNVRVCILAAGRGRRMQNLFQQIPKLLIPINGKTILDRQLEQIPQDWSVVISLGPQGEQVENYIKQFWSHRDINLIIEKNPLKMSKGPAQSLLACRAHLSQPFWLLFSDTLWCEEWPDVTENTLFVGQYKSQSPQRFCNVEFDQQSRVCALYDKVEVVPSDLMKPFVGLAYIQDTELLFDSLSSDQPVEDHQLTRGFESLISKCLKTKPLISWLDVGTPESYSQSEQFLKETEP